MSEMTQALAFIAGKKPLSLIKNPAGTWMFVGSVPTMLRWVTDDPALIIVAMNHGEGLVRSIAKQQGKVFHSRTWATEQDARNAAAELGEIVQ